MKNVSLLAVAISIALSGCGSDLSSTNTQGTQATPKKNMTITAIDGYLSNAIVKGGEKCTKTLGNTNGQGKLVVDGKYQAQAICIEAVKGQTIDLSRGPIEKDFTLSAPAGYTTVSPITTLVSEQMRKGLTESEARKEVVDSLKDLQINNKPMSEDIIFGDFIKDKSEFSNAVELIAETLVDTESKTSLTIEEKLEATEKVSALIAKEMKGNAGKLPQDYALNINKDKNGIQSEGNYKPLEKEGRELLTKDQKAYLIPENSDSVNINAIDISDWFEDKDGDTLTYSVEARLDNETVKTVTIAKGATEITGTFNKAGTYVFYVFAYDGKVRSEPIKFNVVVTAENKAPEIKSDVKDRVQGDLAKLKIEANKAISEDISIDLAHLFTDKDELTYTVEHDLHGKIEIEDKKLTISGTFNKDDVGDKKFSISANDGVNQKVTQKFTIKIKPATVVNHKPVVNNDDKESIQQEIDGLSLKQGQAINKSIDISSLFSDNDNDDLNYKVGNTLADLTTKIENSNLVISGTPTEAADSGKTITITANDGKENSEGVVFTLPKVEEADNNPPTLATNKKAEIQGKIKELKLTKDKAINAETKINLDGLFTDSDDDTINYSATNTLAGVGTTITDSKLVITGTPRVEAADDATSITITASDEKNTATVEFKFPAVVKAAEKDSTPAEGEEAKDSETSNAGN